ncbi:hypothetical protein A8M78_22910 [Escherichia coli]|nr:hypothetical protein PU34_14055 [Escherichia coli]OWE95701.1 hypothetical protein A8M70_23510 [Escherichia coli]OWF11825.1 hypothetical protein A8M78_22910 [Escherichia coli]RCO28625.1 hypothetical protein DTD90_23570 [Escherichia coli]
MIFPLTISHILRKPDKDVPLPDIYTPLSGMHILCSATDIRNLTTYPHTKNKYRTGNITIHHYKIIFMLPVIFMPSQAQKIINNPPRSMQIKENTFHMKYHDIYIARSDGVFMKQFK